eukprot:sb/3471345/
MNLNQFSGTATQTATQFVIAQEKIGLLLGTGGKTFKRIGSLFKVHIHLTSGHHQSGEWVSIYGKEEDRGKAKEYIMSMCNPMVEEQIQYTADLHEHLVGKGGKTHRYLESNSSAVITFSTSCTAPNEHTAHVRGNHQQDNGKHYIQSDPDLVTPDLVTPRFSDRINFPRYRKLTVFDPDLVPTPI